MYICIGQSRRVCGVRTSIAYTPPCFGPRNIHRHPTGTIFHRVQLHTYLSEYAHYPNSVKVNIPFLTRSTRGGSASLFPCVRCRVTRVHFRYTPLLALACTKTKLLLRQKPQLNECCLPAFAERTKFNGRNAAFACFCPLLSQSPVDIACIIVSFEVWTLGLIQFKINFQYEH
jgi:hypothetical protein